MKNITRRTIVSLFLSLLLIIGTGVFVYHFFTDGCEWVSLPSNSHIFVNGSLVSGTITDRDGDLLASADNGIWTYNENQSTRLALLHTIGDPAGKIATGIINKFSGDLTGYNFLTGAKHVGQSGKKIFLTVDAKVCQTAFNALNGYKGTVGVYNYNTGEIICLVSTPTYDPAYPPVINPEDPNYDGVYLNRFYSSSFIPGSTFKLITLTAAIEKYPNLKDMTFKCEKTMKIGDKTITCSGYHGEISVEKALNVSCNCAFAQIANMLGGKTLNSYAEKAGLTDSYSINGIKTKASSFGFLTDSDGNIAWGGVGQGKDLVNPCSMMVYMGAVANGGKAAVPQIIAKKTLVGGLKTSYYINQKTDTLIDSDTAEELTKYMKSNVVNQYGERKFPGLDIYAKTGTAEVDSSSASNSWFVGFLKGEETPYAFVVYAEGGGSGVRTAANIANQVLQAVVSADAENSTQN